MEVKRMGKISIIMLTIAMLMLLIVGCSANNEIKKNDINNSKNSLSVGSQTSLESIKEQSKILKFSSEKELKIFIENNQQSTSYYYGGILSGFTRNSLAMDSIAPTAGAMKSASESAVQDAASGSPQGNAGNFNGDGISDYSKTNVQVDGVDEADIVKTDGNYIYAVVKSTVFIIDSKDLSIKSRITFKNMPSEIYINGNNLIVFGNDYNNDKIKPMYYRYTSFTYVRIFDMTDKEKPTEIKNYDLEGNYFDSRMIGDYVYLISDSYTDINYIPDNESIAPKVLDNGIEKNLPFPDVYYFRMPYNSYKMTTISAINVKDTTQDIAREVYMLSDSQNIYVSQSNIYITYTKYISEYDLMMDVTKEIVTPKLSDKDKEKINKINAVDSEVLSDSEKNQKVLQIIQYYTQRLSDDKQTKLQDEVKTELQKRYDDISKELQKTVIHKISIDKNKIEYKVTGEVTGRVLNQFSMDEKDGTFRIATTKDQTWSFILDATTSKDATGNTVEDNSQKSYSNVYVLDSDLKEVGKLENIAPGEQIYSARFMQDRVYLVTFKQTDPLFVIDLSDAANPKVLGELKMPGFSSYLHPYDETHLIGIGQDTKENQWGGTVTAGLKISLYDVSDVANPKEVDSYTIGDQGTSSQALYDHKAFLFSHDKNLLIIPAEIRETANKDEYWGKLTFSGALVFNISTNGISLKGKISHANDDDKKAMETEYWYYNYETSVKRALYIGDKLYTLSDKYIKENNMSDLSETNSLEFKDAEYVISSGDGSTGTSGGSNSGSSSGSAPVPMPLVK